MYSPEDSNKPVSFTLPSAETIRLRLREVIGDGHLETNLYPRIVKYADTRLQPRGLATIVALAISDCARGMPQPTHVLLKSLAPKIIEALAPDERVAEMAKSFLLEEPRSFDRS